MLGWSAKGCGAAAAVAAGAGADGGGVSAPAGFRMGPASEGLELRETKHTYTLDLLWGRIKQCSEETSLPKKPYVGESPGVWCWILWWT